MKILLLSLTIAVAGLSYTQDMTEEICKLYEAGKYKEVTETFGGQQGSLTYKGLFHVGLSFYKQGKDQTTIDIMDKCISRNKKDSGPHYIKGKALNFMKYYGKAVKSFEKAISLDENSSSYYVGLGDSYMSMNQLDKALTAYKKATKYEDCPERPYHKIPLILSASGKNQLALEAYYTAKENIDKASESYPRLLYTIGLHESMNGDFFDAKIVLQELIEIAPKFYKAYPVLIQANIGLRKYDAVTPLKEKLYEAYKNGLLQDGLKDKFCFEKFVWDDNINIKAYEQFEIEGGDNNFKHIYKVSKNDTQLYSIQTTWTPDSNKPFTLQKHIGADAFTYAVQFDTECSYKELKTAIMSVITEKVEPIAE